MTEELKPCPYCGDLPQIIRKVNPYYTEPTGLSFSFGAAEGESIACVNKMCPMQPSTCPAGNGYLKIFYRNWNTRFTSPDLVVLPKRVVEHIKGTAHSGSLLGGDAAYNSCLTISAICSAILSRDDAALSELTEARGK